MSTWRVMTGGVASVTIALAPGARADELCATVAAPQALAAPWTGALDELRRQIALLPSPDCHPMRLAIEPLEGAVRVVAVTSDGRRAERTVRPGESLVATALGLLMAIPADSPPTQVSAVMPSPIPVTPGPVDDKTAVLARTPGAVIPVASSDVEATPRALVRAPRAPVLWAGLAAGIRLTAPTAVTVLDVEARADVLLHHWLMLSTFRSALASCLGAQGLDCDVYNDVSFGIGVGRRIVAGSAAGDFAFEPSVVWMHMEYDAPAESEAQRMVGSEVALRVDASARLAVPLGESWVLTLTIDAGLAPTMLASTRLDVPAGVSTSSAPPPPFPAWTGGVRLGASGALW